MISAGLDETLTRLHSAELTVVVPHYNHGEVLARCVGSVLSQADATGTTHECVPALSVLIVDDGSEPGDLAVAEALAETDDRVRLIRHDSNQGTVVALNTGLAHVTSPLVQFLGADDMVLPGHAAAMAALLDRYPAASFGCSRVAVLDRIGGCHGVRPFSVPMVEAGWLDPSSAAQALRFSDNWANNVSVVARTEIVRQAGGFDPTLGAFCDAFLVRQMIGKGGIAFDPRVLACWTSAGVSYSAAVAHNIEGALKMFATVQAELATIELARLEPEYPQLCLRRLRFQTARLHMRLAGKQPDAKALSRLCEMEFFDHLALQILSAAGWLAQPLVTAYLTLRLRPMALRALLKGLKDSRLWHAQEQGRVEVAVEKAARRAEVLKSARSIG